MHRQSSERYWPPLATTNMGFVHMFDHVTIGVCTGDEPTDRLRTLRVLLSAYMLRRAKAALICSNSLSLPPLTECIM